MANYDPQAAGARRFPRVISPEEIHAMPRLTFEPGIETAIFLSQERDDARHFRQGYCYQEADHTPYRWDQANFDETQYCLEGKIRLKVEDAAGRVVHLEAGPGEHLFLPGGYKYTLEPTGERTVFFWTTGPSPRYGLVELPGFSATLKSLRK